MPKEPPFTVSVVGLPEHIGFTVAVIEVGSTDVVSTLIVVAAQAVVPQAPSALTQ